jgi:hypothetical protein
MFRFNTYAPSGANSSSILSFVSSVDSLNISFFFYFLDKFVCHLIEDINDFAISISNAISSVRKLQFQVEHFK